MEEWYEEFACWFVSLPLPTQGQLGSCFGALSLHLGSRLDASWRAARASLGRRGEPNPTKPSAQLPVAESGCAWVGESESLGLPSFPEFPTNLDFNLPPIPRLLPPWEQLRALRHEAPQQEHARLRWREEPAGRLSPAQPAGRGGAHATQMAQATLTAKSQWTQFGLGLGGGAAVSLALFFGILRGRGGAQRAHRTLATRRDP